MRSPLDSTQARPFTFLFHCRPVLPLSVSVSPPPASQDNFFDVAPPLLFFAGLVTFVQWKRHQILMEHRD